ncbi:sigma-54-dependent transcriptional regulator [Roseomonas marmotae]|uniref:Sigma-54-dependent Fis family transcriptional regulator n=1 Tax=Roseomonas marmotae TaxID=2768161 RepID=A0ABS3K877_9PROT|nr:sigma-54 dependent transcriptional regulator [Roseomonas marmotae]MBO1073632.1 sigma-54-dependent Fis family transcriptional regulator [Roseomonas marmotae]MBO1073662.1 sigma-54-dependent Fis family transcriptional regulator [Roseomonas marmotae]QTI80190.1 sigma-54-dependent Fis family transcriptional regulator [Roseomonas marmotae]
MSPTPSRSVVLIEDDEVLGESLVQRLTLEGIATAWARSAREGEALLRRQRPTLIVCDIRLPDGNGEALLTRLMPELGGTPIIVVTAFGDVAQAVRLLRAGADDYVEKPFPAQLLIDKLATYAGWAAPDAPAADITGWSSPAMRTLRRHLLKLGLVDTTVLLGGESGAGKEVAARVLHDNGSRAVGPFVAINCAAIPAELLESQIFGHERGAFTGAAERQAGLAERAAGGTLFLDEVAELGPAPQAKLLRLLQERRFTRLGGREELPLQARIIAASNADLRARVAEGRFREDLFYRLAVVELTVPPLRERPEDLGALAAHFLRHFASAFGREEPQLSAPAFDALLAHDWPGNVRELRNRVERAMVLAEGTRLEAADLFPERRTQEAPPLSLAEARDAAEREHIRRVLARAGSRVGDAAQLLGISRTTLWERMRRLGLKG